MKLNRERKALHIKIAHYINRHPELTYREMQERTHISVSTLTRIALKFGIVRKPQKEPYVVSAELIEELES